MRFDDLTASVPNRVWIKCGYLMYYFDTTYKMTGSLSVGTHSVNKMAYLLPKNQIIGP